MTRLRQPRRKGQRGAALLTAMIIVALVATLAAAMVWQQWRAVQVEAAERARAQSAWILTGARDFAGLILKEDFKGGGRTKTALTEPWALPLKESRLSTFLAVDKANADDGPEAFLSGDIADAQAKFNLRNLIGADGKPNPDALAVLQRLCGLVSLDGSVASRIASGLIAAIGPAGAGGTAAAPLEPKTIAQLTWLGIDQSAVTALAPFVVLLPEATKVNVNTASKEVLAAVANIDPGSAERLVQIRQRKPFVSAPLFITEAAPPPGTTPDIDVRSNYFEVRGSLRLTDHVLTERSLVQRDPGSGNVTPKRRERIASLTQAGG
jgi:general secretion pathway protein K